MGSFFSLLLSAVGLGSPPAPPPSAVGHEASMNFDMENVAQFLDRLNAKLLLGLDVKMMSTFTSDTKLDEERSLKFDVKFRGKAARLEYHVFMDDIDAPDLAFVTSSELLAKAIDSELMDFADEFGI